MKQPHCHVIAHASSRVVDDCFESLSRHGWQFTKFDAVDGYNITQADWERIGVAMNDQGKMPRRPGAQGCWISHFSLWNKCRNINTPIVVMEHDALVTAPWPQDLNITEKLIKLYTSASTKFNTSFGNWSKGSHAYTLTPEQANILITHAQKYGAQAVDKHLGDLILLWSFLGWDLVKINQKKGPSSTSSANRKII
jgi:glycosyl transferase family 25